MLRVFNGVVIFRKSVVEKLKNKLFGHDCQDSFNASQILFCRHWSGVFLDFSIPRTFCFVLTCKYVSWLGLFFHFMSRTCLKTSWTQTLTQSNFSGNRSFCQICQNCIRVENTAKKLPLTGLDPRTVCSANFLSHAFHLGYLVKC